MRALWGEYVDEAREYEKENQEWVKTGVQGFWEWLLTGKIRN